MGKSWLGLDEISFEHRGDHGKEEDISRAGKKFEIHLGPRQSISVFSSPPLKYYLPNRHDDEKEGRMFVFFNAT